VNKDITVTVHLASFEFQARLLNDGWVRVFLEGALAGTAFWNGSHLVERSATLSDSVYDALGSALAIELTRGDFAPLDWSD
jgi:hypothetical protein